MVSHKQRQFNVHTVNVTLVLTFIVTFSNVFVDVTSVHTK